MRTGTSTDFFLVRFLDAVIVHIFVLFSTYSRVRDDIDVRKSNGYVLCRTVATSAHSKCSRDDVHWIC